MLLSASATAVLQGASTFMGFLLSVLLAHFLGGVGYGRYAIAFAWASFLLTPALLGFDRFLVRGISVYEVQQRWAPMKGLMRRANQLVLFASTAIALAGTLIALTLLSPTLRAPFCAAMLVVPLTALCLVRQGSMQAIGQVVRGQLPEYLIRPVAIVLVVLVLGVFGDRALTPFTALLANALGVAVALLVGTSLLKRARPAALAQAVPQFETPHWLRSSLPMMLISGIWMANSYAAILMVGALDGPRAAGVYNVVQKGAELIVLVLFAANMPLAPLVARMHARGDRAGLQYATERMARATLLVSAPLAGAFIAFPNLYLALFGRGFQGGAEALVILAVGQLVNAAAGPSGNVLMMTGHERLAARGVAVGLVANVALAAVLVPPLGVTGGAVAFAVSLAIWNVVLVRLARRRLGVNVTAFAALAVPMPGDEERRSAATQAMAGPAMAGAAAGGAATVGAAIASQEGVC